MALMAFTAAFLATNVHNTYTNSFGLNFLTPNKSENSLMLVKCTLLSDAFHLPNLWPFYLKNQASFFLFSFHDPLFVMKIVCLLFCCWKKKSVQFTNRAHFEPRIQNSFMTRNEIKLTILAPKIVLSNSLLKYNFWSLLKLNE